MDPTTTQIQYSNYYKHVDNIVCIVKHLTFYQFQLDMVLWCLIISGHISHRIQPAHLVSCIIRGGTANINFVHNNRA